MMQQAIGDGCIYDTHSGEILKSFTTERDTGGDPCFPCRFFRQLDHRLRRIDRGDTTRRQRPREADGDVAWPTTQVENVARRKPRKGFTEEGREALVLVVKICP